MAWVIRKQEELARLAEVVEADSLGPLGIDQRTGQAPHPFEFSVRTNQGQDTREQTSRDQGQQAPGQGRGEDGSRFHVSMEAPLQARQLGNKERGRREQPPQGYLRLIPMLTRGRAKLEAERSGLDDVVEEVVRGDATRGRRS